MFASSIDVGFVAAAVIGIGLGFASASQRIKNADGSGFG
jgi:ABC-type nitrate/sulfonate/bicarbonate transport system permease component